MDVIERTLENKSSARRHSRKHIMRQAELQSEDVIEENEQDKFQRENVKKVKDMVMDAWKRLEKLTNAKKIFLKLEKTKKTIQVLIEQQKSLTRTLEHRLKDCDKYSKYVFNIKNYVKLMQQELDIGLKSANISMKPIGEEHDIPISKEINMLKKDIFKMDLVAQQVTKGLREGKLATNEKILTQKLENMRVEIDRQNINMYGFHLLRHSVKEKIKTLKRRFRPVVGLVKEQRAVVTKNKRMNDLNSIAYDKPAKMKKHEVEKELPALPLQLCIPSREPNHLTQFDLLREKLKCLKKDIARQQKPSIKKLRLPCRPNKLFRKNHCIPSQVLNKYAHLNGRYMPGADGKLHKLDNTFNSPNHTFETTQIYEPWGIDIHSNVND